MGLIFGVKEEQPSGNILLEVENGGGCSFQSFDELELFLVLLEDLVNFELVTKSERTVLMLNGFVGGIKDCEKKIALPFQYALCPQNENLVLMIPGRGQIKLADPEQARYLISQCWEWLGCSSWAKTRVPEVFIKGFEDDENK